MSSTDCVVGARAGGCAARVTRAIPPAWRERLTTSERSQIVGYDLVVAAPRPLSTLLAVDPFHASGVVDAHRASVRAAVDYLEDRALVVREQRGGEVRERSANVGACCRFHPRPQSSWRTAPARSRA